VTDRDALSRLSGYNTESLHPMVTDRDALSRLSGYNTESLHPMVTDRDALSRLSGYNTESRQSREGIPICHHGLQAFCIIT
jgi:acetolactate synthase small subunit